MVVRLFAVERLRVDVLFFVVRFVPLALFLAEFAELFRGAAFARVARFLVVFFRRCDPVRLDRFFAVAFRGPDFLAAAALDLVPVDRVPRDFLVPVAFFFAGAFRDGVFRARAVRAGGRPKVSIKSGSPTKSSGVAAYSGNSSSAPSGRRAPRHPAMITAPRP